MPSQKYLRLQFRYAFQCRVLVIVYYIQLILNVCVVFAVTHSEKVFLGSSDIYFIPSILSFLKLHQSTLKQRFSTLSIIDLGQNYGP